MSLRAASSVRHLRALSNLAQCSSLVRFTLPYLPIVAGQSFSTTPIRAKSRQAVKTTKTFEAAPPALDDVPSAFNLQTMLQHPVAPAYLKGMTGEQARSLLAEYTQRTLALRDPPREWRLVLRALARGDEANEPAVRATLHSLACVLVLGPPGPQMRLATHVLHILGTKALYAPSELSMARMALVGKRMDQPLFANTVERVKTGRVYCETDADRANCQTLRGLICAASSKTPQAARDALWWFQQAVDPSKGRRAPGAFDWQAACMVEMGRCYKRLGDLENAEKVWEFAATELDSPEATGLFAAAAMDKTDPKAEEMLTRAAMGGYRAAQVQLAAVEQAKWKESKSKGVKGWDLTLRKVMKDEWETLSAGMSRWS